MASAAWGSLATAPTPWAWPAHQQDALPGHPADGQHRTALDAVVVPTVQVPAHPEVGNLDGIVLAHQAVPCGQVTVDEIQGGKVLHARGDLSRHELQVGITEGKQKGKSPVDRKCHDTSTFRRVPGNAGPHMALCTSLGTHSPHTNPPSVHSELWGSLLPVCRPG